MEPFYESDACSNKKNSEEDGQQYSNQQHAAAIFIGNFEEGKNEDEYKDVVNAQRPLHQVGRDVFGSEMGRFFKPQKNKKGKRKTHPEQGLK